MNKTTAFLLLSISLISFSFCKPSKSGGTKSELPKMFVNAESGLRLRSSPNRQGKVIITVPFGQPLFIAKEGNSETIDGKTSNWMNVKYMKHSGWVFGGYLAGQMPEKVQKAETDNLPADGRKLNPADAKSIALLAGANLSEAQLAQFRGLDYERAAKPAIINKSEEKGIRMVTITPADECSHYGSSDCFNFIFKGSEMLADFERASFGSFDKIAGNFALFNISLGEGDGCGSGGESTVTAIDVRNLKAYRIQTSFSSTCKNCETSDEGPVCRNDEYDHSSQSKYSDLQGKTIHPSAELLAALKKPDSE